VKYAEQAGQHWTFPFWSIGLAGLLWVPLWLLLVGRRDLRTPKVDAEQPPKSTRLVGSKLLVLAIIVGTLTISWQFLRAWLALFLEDHHQFTRNDTLRLMSLYFIAADVGCLLSGAFVKLLTSRGWGLHRSRVFGFAVFAMLTASAVAVPFAGDGTLMVVLLLITGAGILGLHPFYYALAQELPTQRMGVLSGLLAGQHIQESKSYDLGLCIVGLAPLLGLAALLLLWRTDEPAPIRR
jgi:MFS transporter, ACS family, hexuronate transporter